MWVYSYLQVYHNLWKRMWFWNVSKYYFLFVTTVTEPANQWWQLGTYVHHTSVVLVIKKKSKFIKISLCIYLLHTISQSRVSCSDQYNIVTVSLIPSSRWDPTTSMRDVSLWKLVLDNVRRFVSTLTLNSFWSYIYKQV